MAHAVGIDIGTTNVKVALVRDDGWVVGSAARPLVTRRQGEVAEQDAARLWDAVRDAVRAVTTAHPTAAADVGHLGVCSQYSSIVAVDADGDPLSPLILYLDERGTAPSWAIMERHPEAFDVWIERHGIPPIGSGLSLGHLLHLQHDRPDIHALATAYLEPMDFVNLRLTGRVAANQCTVFAGQLTDNRTLDATAYDDELLALSGIDVATLPPLLGIDEPVGPVRPEVAADLGLPARVVVQAGMNDSHAGAFATGAYIPGRAGIMVGTTAVMLDTLDHKDLDIDHELVSMPSPLPGTYLAMAENGIAGKAVEHVLEKLVYAVDQLGDHVTDDQFAQLDASLAAVPSGAGGAIFLPWLTGSLAPNVDRAMRGGFINVSLDTDRASLVRATVEGVCRNLRWLAPFVEGFTGNVVDHYVLGGGAARSTQWAQIMADILDRPVLPLVDPETTVARATAMVALHRSGAFDFGDLAGLVATSGTHEPDPATRQRHDHIQEQFVAAFDALQPICQALNP